MPSQKIKAFTLVELIIVITILAILATIGFMSFQGYISDARDGNRITSLKTIQSSLNIYKIKNQKLPLPDNYVDVIGISYQGNIGTGIINKLKLSGTFKDPKDYNYYTYSASKNLSKFQISSLLENNNKIIFSFNDYLNNKLISNNNLLNQVYADNISRYTYTLGDRIGILLDTTTNTPVNELLNGTGILNLNTDDNTYTAVFTNDATNSGTITGSGTNLRTEISIVQNSCVLGSSVITSGQQINAYNTNSIAYNQTCIPIIRSCNNGVLSGDANYKYDTCSPVAALNCTETTYNGYTIPVINHNSNRNVTKNITGGVADINASCVNGVLSYGNENINCNSGYVLDGGICKEDKCTGNAPDFSTANGTIRYNNPWVHTLTPGICTFVCQIGYYYSSNLCNPASIGNYVRTSGQTNQTACSANDKYQDTTGQTSCKDVSTGYYSTPIGNVAHTGQTQCEANNYCVGGLKYACSAGYSSPAGASICLINQYTVNGTITNGNGATVNICGKITTADASGNFSVTVNYGTNCNNLTITRTNYTCSVSTNGSSSITSNSAVSGICNANTQSIEITDGTCNQTWNGSSWDYCTSGTCTNGSTWNSTYGCAIAVNGSCGSANGKYRVNSPNFNELCNVGISSNIITNSSNYSRSCKGENGGNLVNCFSNILKTPIAGSNSTSTYSITWNWLSGGGNVTKYEWSNNGSSWINKSNLLYHTETSLNCNTLYSNRYVRACDDLGTCTSYKTLNTSMTNIATNGQIIGTSCVVSCSWTSTDYSNTDCTNPNGAVSNNTRYGDDCNNYPIGCFPAARGSWKRTNKSYVYGQIQCDGTCK